MEKENDTFRLWLEPGMVELSNKKTGVSCRLYVDDNIQLGQLIEVIFGSD